MAATAPVRSDKWLQGPVSDVVLGTGLLYVPIFAMLLVLGPHMEAATPLFLVPLLVLFFSNPHLGATLLRVYERPQDRHAYAFFAVWVTLLIGAFFFASLAVPVVGSWFITFYLTIVPWHFTGQNYGVALVFLRRRGVDITPTLKRFIYAAFVLPFVLWILALHAEQAGPVEYAPLGTRGTRYEFFSVGIPGVIQGPAILLAILAYGWVLCECVIRMRRVAPISDLLPAAALFFSQALWFAAPVVAAVFLEPDRMGPFAPEHAAFTFAWISIMHAVQYMWITNYYVKKERPGTRTSGFLLKALLAGTAIYGIPALLLAPGVLGKISYNGGLQLMLAGALNIHHVILDGAIWKLRNARVAKILIRGDQDAPPERARGRSWLKAAVLVSGALGVFIVIAGTIDSEYAVPLAKQQGDTERLRSAVRRLAWIGQDDANTRAELGFLLAQRGDPDAAIREFERSIAIRPSAIAWTNIGALHEQQGRLEEAIAAYGEAIALDPDDIAALHYAGRASLKAGQTARAREYLERAVALAPERADIRAVLAEAARG